MYIRIINKNRQGDSNVYEDFTPYTLDEGSVYTTIYGEELDSFDCRISNLLSTIEIEPYDRVAIYDNSNNLITVMDVESYDCDMIGYTSDTRYSYDIHLCSMTKELENYILPNLSITPRKVGTRKTVYEYIVQYMDLFTPTIEHGGYTYDLSLATKFNNFAPELQWNEPTLREVLTSLMMTKDCIPIVKYMNGAITLSYMDLTQVGNEITGYNYIRSSRSMTDYNSELRMTMQNVMQPDSTTTTVEYIPFTSDDYILTSENIKLKTQFPILNIKHLYLGVYTSSTFPINNQHLYTIDLMNVKNNCVNADTGGKLIYEAKEYQTLNELYRWTGSDFDTGRVDELFSKKRNFCLYYARGNNEIQGFNNTVKYGTAGDITTLQFLQTATPIFASGYPLRLDLFFGPTAIDNVWFSTFFKIEYETMYDQVFQASKERYQSHHRVIADNQQFSWVDANTQANLEYQKANRLGNPVVLINSRNVPIALGDTIDDNIVYKVEKQIYTDHAEYNAYATKNYILRDKFTAIDAKIRTYVNAQDEAFIRSDLKKFYCVFQSYAQNDTSVTYAGLSQALLSPIDQAPHNSSIKHVGLYNLQFPFTQSTESDVMYYVGANVLSRQLGKSMVFSFGFADNWVACTSPDITDSALSSDYPNLTNNYVSANGGVMLKPFPYVDNNGEVVNIKYRLATNKYNANDIVDITTTSMDTNEIIETGVWCFNNPLMLKDAINDFVVLNDTWQLYKDNKEIPMFNLQFEFISDDNDIMVTNKWVELQKWLNDYNTAKPYTIYSSPVANWNFRSNALPSDTTQLQGVTLQTDCGANNRAKITLQRTDDKHCYYVVIDNEVVLAFKGQNTETNIYMNILSRRDQNTYNAKGVIVNG